MSNDDIVTRLRDSKLDCDYCDSWHINGQAADEIERLRKELADYQRTVRALEDELFMAEKWRDNYEIGLNDYKKSTEYWYSKAKENE